MGITGIFASPGKFAGPIFARLGSENIKEEVIEGSITKVVSHSKWRGVS